MAVLQQLKEAGAAIVFTSHYTDELALLADGMLALKQGAVTFDGGIDFPQESGGLPGAIRKYTA